MADEEKPIQEPEPTSIPPTELPKQESTQFQDIAQDDVRRILLTPKNDLDVPNKKYVDDQVATKMANPMTIANSIIKGGTSGTPTALGPSHGTNDYMLVCRAANDSVEWAAEFRTFLDLADTPALYAGAGSKIVAVNSGATALEFITLEATSVERIVASDSLKKSLDTERTTTELAYILVKTYQIQREGIVRIKFDIAEVGGVGTAYGRIYKNGVATGTQQTTSDNAYSTKSEDLACVPGDIFSLYYYTSAADHAAKIRNYRFYWDVFDGTDVD
jgi:hypothetical protein